MRASDRRGFSLAEILMAVALLGSAGIAVSGLFTVLVSSTVQAREELRVEAAAVAVMEEVLSRPYDELEVSVETGRDDLGIDWAVYVTQEDDHLRRIAVTATDGRVEASLETLFSDRF